jgi:hypothetical protein
MVRTNDVRQPQLKNDGSMSQRMWRLPTGRQRVRRASLILLALVVGFGGLTIAIERWSAVPGWGHCYLSCHGVSKAVVERVTGIDLPDDAVVLSATGDHDGGFLAKQMVDAVIRIPASNPLPIETGPDASGCFGRPQPDPFRRWGASDVRFREVYGTCRATGTLPDGNAVVHVLGVRRIQRCEGGINIAVGHECPVVR